MNKISSLDIRIAVLAYPLVSKEEGDLISKGTRRPIVPFRGDERIVSLFNNSPKALIDPSPSKVPRLLRKGQFVLIKLIEVLKTLIQEKTTSNVFSEIAPPKELLVPQLPHPPFQSNKPPRFFWHPAYLPPKDEYTPGCLISEAKEEMANTVYNSTSICAYARQVLPKTGILRQDTEEFVYLELSDDFITDLFPLLHDREVEAIPLYYLEPSPAHIPVILPHEWSQKKGWGDLQDLEKSLSFEITHLCSLKPKCMPGVEKVYFLRLKSPELERIREKCLLPSLIRGHEFHIAIAFKKAAFEQKPSPQKETFRLNVSCYAA